MRRSRWTCGNKLQGFAGVHTLSEKNNTNTFVDGIDLDFNRVLITYPTPKQLPRGAIDKRFR